MIAVSGLEKRFGRHLALHDLEFTVPQGEIFGFLGPNGAGKTTTIRILATLALPDAGTATIGGVQVDREPYRVQKLIGYVPDSFGVYERLTTLEYLEFYAACHDLPPRRGRLVARELLELVALGDRAGDQVDTLSRGMKQRLCLARALVHDPQVLLLDEPASGLDPRARVEMRELIRELRRMGKTVLVSSHIVPEIEELCTWVGVIDQGRMVAVGPKAAVLGQAGAGRRFRIELVAGERKTDPPSHPPVGVRGGEGVAERALALLERRAGVMAVEPSDEILEVTVEEGFAEERLVRELVEAGFDLRQFTPLDSSLSDVFLRLTGPAGDDS